MGKKDFISRGIHQVVIGVSLIGVETYERDVTRPDGVARFWAYKLNQALNCSISGSLSWQVDSLPATPQLAQRKYKWLPFVTMHLHSKKRA